MTGSPIHSRSLITVLLLLSLSACQQPQPFFYDFENDSSLDRIHWKCGVVYSLAPRYATSGVFSLRTDFYPAERSSGSQYPGLSFTGFAKDWSGAQRVTLDLFNPAQGPISLSIRIDDTPTPTYEERYNRGFLIPPGRTTLSLPMDTLTTSGSDRLLDTKKICAVYLFLAQPQKVHTLYFDNIRLE